MSNRITPSASRIDQRRAAGGGKLAPRSRGRRSRDRSRPRSATRARKSRPLLGGAAGFGRDQARAGDAAVAHLVAADREAPRPRARSPASLRRPEAVMPSPSRMMREKASMTRKPSPRRRAPPAGGNCWCRDRAPHRSGSAAPNPSVPRRAVESLTRMPIRRPPARRVRRMLLRPRSARRVEAPVARASSSIENLSRTPKPCCASSAQLDGAACHNPTSQPDSKSAEAGATA